MEKNAKEEIRNAVGRFSEGEFTPEAVRQVHRWLLLRKDFEWKKEAWEEVWERTEAVDEDVTDSLAATYRRAAVAAEQARRQRSTRRLWLRRVASAAAVALVVLTAFVSSRLTERAVRASEAMVCVTTVDSARSVTLPDGSVVRLKRGTTLLYPERFSRQSRDVQLIGEARFDVRKADGKPFRVHALGAQVVVRGTVFHLKACPDRDVVEAVLVSGAIDFAASGQVVPLKPSQKLTYDTRDNGIEVREVDLAEELKPNLHLFRGGSLREAAAIVSRVFSYPVRLEDPASGRIEISGTITIDGDNSLPHALDILTLTTGTRYRFADGEAVIY